MRYTASNVVCETGPSADSPGDATPVHLPVRRLPRSTESRHQSGAAAWNRLSLHRLQVRGEILPISKTHVLYFYQGDTTDTGELDACSCCPTQTSVTFVFRLVLKVGNAVNTNIIRFLCSCAFQTQVNNVIMFQRYLCYSLLV